MYLTRDKEHSGSADTLGGRIVHARELQDLTTAQLARRVGVKTATLHEWETDRSEPRSNRLLTLAGMLNVSPTWLLTGEGESFSAGADLNWMRTMAQANEHENERDALHLARMLRMLNFFRAPTVACVNGPAYGGGLGLMACCDVTIASDAAQFALTEVRLGIAPAVISPYVFRLVGEGNARRYFLTGERFDRPAHALAKGAVAQAKHRADFLAVKEVEVGRYDVDHGRILCS